MAKRVIMALFLIAFLIDGETSAMEPEETKPQETREIPPSELDGTLEYTNLMTNETASFKIRTKVKDGIIDLSDKAFRAAAKYLVITTDPSVFSASHPDKLVILIAPWELIHNNLETSSAPFKPIMKEWDKRKAPIGIFFRDGSLPIDTNHIFFATELDVPELNSMNLSEIFFKAKHLGAIDDKIKKMWGKGTYKSQAYLNIQLHFALKPKGMKPSEKENAQKMMMLKEHLDPSGIYPQEVFDEIARKLHELSKNPVLDSTLEYRNLITNETTSFKVRPKVKDGMIDLSDATFKGAAKFLVITTDPSVFCASHPDMLVILIAPWELINVNLETTAEPFKPLMKDWNEKNAPIGIFFRDGSLHIDTNHIFFVTELSIPELNSMSLSQILQKAKHLGGIGTDIKSSWAPGTYKGKAYLNIRLHYPE